jgi:predicted dehydrogenase
LEERKMEVGFGIVGCGMIASFAARAVDEIPGARLVATFSRNESRAESVAEPYDATAYTDFDAFLDRQDLDVIYVSTPSGTHADYTIPAAKAGKHVIVEKPIDITLQRARAMAQACDEAGVKLGVISQSRFTEGSRILKEAIDGGRFGRLTIGDAYVKWYRNQAYYDKGGWKGTRALDGGGALINQSIHAIDLLQWFMGPVKEVTAFCDTLAHERIDVEDTAVAALRFANGALGVVVGATSAYPGFLKRIEISGSRGSAILEEQDITYWRFDPPDPKDKNVLERFTERRSGGGGAADPAGISHVGHRKQFEDFLAAIAEDRPPLVDAQEGIKSLEIILAIYASSAERRPVSLPL